MRPLFRIIAFMSIWISAAACRADSAIGQGGGELPEPVISASTTISPERLWRARAALDAMYPQTRGHSRKTYSRQNLVVCGGCATRSESTAGMPDTLAYVVNFDNSEGFAVLGAQQGL